MTRLILLLVVFLVPALGQNSLDCFVGYQYNNSAVIGGSVECDGGTCVRATTILGGTRIKFYVCEPLNLCNSSTNFLNGLVDLYCCKNVSNCNYPDMRPTTAPPPHVTPSLCYEGIFANTRQLLGTRTPTICYGDCASISLTISNSAQFNGTFTMATCDPVSICHSLDLENSCHTLSQNIISGCCCTGNLCLDPANGIQPTPIAPPPNAIKCPAGVQIIDNKASDNPKSAITTVDCIGSCHDTSYTVVTADSNITYHIYMCDEKGVCDMLNIPMNSCSKGNYINSCCCDSSNCNLGTLTGLIPQDPFPPMRAERCFGGFALEKLANVPLGKSERCFGDCVTYTLAQTPIGAIKIFGCDPVSICQKFNAEQGPVTDDGLQIACCTTRDCNQPFTQSTNNISCITGVSVSYGNSLIVKGISTPCTGLCGNYSASVGTISVDVFTCDTYNLCQLPFTGTTHINSACCNATNCNVGDVTHFQPINTTGKPVIECFMGLELNRIGAVGYHVSCAGYCTRVHLSDSTFFLCDVADVCSSYGVDGCYILADGLSICCCNGDRCSDKDKQIRPHVIQDLTCLIGYGIGNLTRGGIMPCNGMCGRFETSLGNLMAVAYVCLDYDLCMGMSLYEECRNLRFDQAIRGCCCGGQQNCNYWGDKNVTFPTPAPSTKSITCPEGVWINDKSDYDSYHVTSCQGNCGSVTFQTTFQGLATKMTYFGCDPASFCKNANLVEGCGNLTSAMGGCCCSTSMCMDPLSGVFQPATAPPPPPMCFVGFGFNSQTLTGGSVPCAGSCLHASGNISTGVTMNLFACEPLGICGLLNSVTNVFDVNCCETDNCNAVGYTMPPTVPTVSVDPILCYEGIAFNGNPIANKTIPSLCYGQCAKLSVVIAGTIIDAYTCDPVSLCESLGLSNNCHPGLGNGTLTGCCCNTNNCIAPGKNIPSTTPTPLVITTPVPKLQCFIGYQIGNNPLKGGSSPCPGQCMKASKIVSNTQFTIFACEPNNVCSLSISTSTDITCCNNNNNCNAQDMVIPTTDPTATLPPPILCYEGIYVNGKPIADNVDPVRCYGQCASISVKTGTDSSYVVYTCDPASLCDSLQLKNKCLLSESGIFTGCCCDSNQCLNPRNNITVPITQKPNVNCFVGFRIGNGNLVGGSSSCPGQCMSASKTYNNTQLTIYACEPASICSAPNNIPTVSFSCCNNADNCNAAGLTIPPSPTTPFKPIVCFEGVYINGRAQGIGSPSVCNGQCTSISVKTGTDSFYSVYTCDPGNLCTTLNLTNKCVPSSSGLFTGCCCNSDQCLDPANGVTVPQTTVTPKTNLNCFIGFQIGNGNLIGGSSSCPGQCMAASKMVNNTKLTIYACEPNLICSSPNIIPTISFSCCADTDNCNAGGLPIPTSPTPTPSSKTIVCYEGVYVNGKEQNGGLAQVCNGQCSSISVKTGNDSSYEVFTCDSNQIALCTSLKMQNSCQQVSGIFTGCCCDSDLCLNPRKGVLTPGTSPPTPQPTTSKANSAIFSIIAFIFVFLFQ